MKRTRDLHFMIYPRLQALLLSLSVILPQCSNNEKYRPPKLRSHVLNRTFNEMAIGDDEKRRDSYDPQEEQRRRRETGDTGIDSFASSFIEELLIPTENDILKGYIYRPAKAALEPARVVIFLSGSAGSNPSMAGGVVNAYTNMGALVVGVDYRGFGRSGSGKTAFDGTNITETSLYEDAYSVYRYVQTVLGIESDRIILHGFSLGGAVAACLSASIAAKGMVRIEL